MKNVKFYSLLIMLVASLFSYHVNASTCNPMGPPLDVNNYCNQDEIIEASTSDSIINARFWIVSPDTYAHLLESDYDSSGILQTIGAVIIDENGQKIEYQGDSGLTTLSLNINSLSVGEYIIEYSVLYKVLDNNGGGDLNRVNDSRTVSLTSVKKLIIKELTPPAINDLSILNREQIVNGDYIKLRALASDDGGDINKIDLFYVNKEYYDESLPPEITFITIGQCLYNSGYQKECFVDVKATTVGNHQYRAVVIDSEGNSDGEYITIDVKEKNRDPIITDISIASIVGDVILEIDENNNILAKNTIIRFNVTALDLDQSEKNKIKEVKWYYSINGDVYNEILLSHSNCELVDNGAKVNCIYDWQIPTTVTGNITVKAVATDKVGASVSKSRSFTVKEPPTALTLASISPTEFIINNTINLSASVSGSITNLKICYGPQNYSGIHCQNEIKSCSSSPCSTSYKLNNSHFTAGNIYHFYAVATDGINETITDGYNRNITSTYTVAITSVSSPVNEVYYPNETVEIATSYNKLDNNPNHTIAVAKIEFYANEAKVGELVGNAVNGSFNYVLPDNESIILQAILVDSLNNHIFSNQYEIDINTGIPAKPSVQITDVNRTPITESQGQYKIVINPVANTTSYQLYEKKEGVVTALTLSGLETLISKEYEDNGRYEYYVKAVNPNGVSAASTSQTVLVKVPDQLPGLTEFSDMALSQDGPYILRWQNKNLGARYFILEGKRGGLSSDAEWQALTERIDNLDKAIKEFQVNELDAGDFSYQIRACNNDNVCHGVNGVGEQLTINHQVPYISSAVLNQNTLSIYGIGLSSVNSVSIQLRNSAQTFIYDVDASQATTQMITFILSDNLADVSYGLNHGGLRIQLNNQVNSEPASIVIDNTAEDDRIDLVGSAPTVSAEGIIYVGVGRKIHALDVESGQDISQWPYEMPQARTGEFIAAPTLDKDINNQDEIYIGSTDRYFYKLNHQAQLQWDKLLRGKVYAQAALLNGPLDEQVVRKLLYVGVDATDRERGSGLYAINSIDGKINWMYPLPQAVTQKPTIYGNGLLNIITADEQLHLIDRQNIGGYALRWQDMDSSLIASQLMIDEWQIPQDLNVPMDTIIGFFYGVLQRGPTLSELTFFVYAHHQQQMNLEEIASAFLNSDKGIQYFPTSMSDQAFIDQLFSQLFAAYPNKTQLKGKTRAEWGDELVSGQIYRSAVLVEFIQSLDYSAITAPNVALVKEVYFNHGDTNQYADADNDGIPDVVEIELGYNPLDPHDLIISEPNLIATDPQLGQFELSWDNINSPDPSKNIYYVLNEAANNNQAIELAAINDATDKVLVKPSGDYDYQVKACIHEKVCGQWSNIADVTVTDSIAEAKVQPEAAPNTIAEFTPPSESEINLSAQLNVTAGDFRVTESGSVSYTVPIAAPKGIAGVTPEVALSYNSLSRGGLVGIGWNVQGLSSISLCPKTRLEDGENRPILFDGLDPLCFDGQRLILLAGNYNTVGAVYGTQVDNQVKITQLSSGFQVEGKDNSIRVYGNSLASQVIVKDIDENDVVQTWLLSHSQDNLRQEVNEIRYHYNDTDQFGDNEKVLTNITYSGNSIDFIYSNDDLKVNNSGYINGLRYSSKAGLESIKVTNHQGIEIRSYQFEFENNSIGQRQLKSLTECGIDSICKRPVYFDYRPTYVRNPNHSSSAQELYSITGDAKIMHALVLDVNANGLSDFVTLAYMRDRKYSLCVTLDNQATKTCKYISRVTDEVDDVSIIPTDPDGDGKISLLMNKSDSKTDARWVAIDVNAQSNALYWPTTSVFDDARELSNSIKPMDFDGDGYNDLIETRNGTIYVHIWNSVAESYSKRIEVEVNNDDLAIRSGWQSIDINRDGLSDIMAWRKCTGSCDDVHGNSLVFMTSSFVKAEPSPENIGDCQEDGDERSRRANYTNRSNTYSTRVCQATKSDHYRARAHSSINVKGKFATPFDFNSDGLTDVVVYDTLSQRWKYFLNNGLTFIESDENEFPASISNKVPPIISDVDGDGLIELVFNEGSKWYRYEWTNQEQFKIIEGENPVIDPCNNQAKYQVNAVECRLPQTRQSNQKTVVENGFAKQQYPVSDWRFAPSSEKSDLGYFTDFNNDGIVELVYKTDKHVKMYDTGTAYFAPGMLDKITTATGIRTQIEYKPLTDTSVYTKGDRDQTALLADGATRVVDSVSATPVVASVTTDAPATDNNSSQVSIDYHYSGSRAQFGRGSLGFESLSTTTVKDGYQFITKTQYHQNFPLTGMPYKTIKSAEGIGGTVDVGVLSIAVNRYQVNEVERLEKPQYQIYQNETRECTARIDNDENGNLYTSWNNGYQCSQAITTQDVHANVLSSQTAKYELSDAHSFTNLQTDDSTPQIHHGWLKLLQTNSTYYTENDGLRLGRLKQTTVQHKRPDTDTITRTSAFKYYTGGAKSGMLWQEIIEPDGNCSEYLNTQYQYDDVGNLTQKTVTNKQGCSPTLQRQSITHYDGQGRYVESQSNGEFITQRVEQLNPLGLATKVSNTDGAITQMVYDAFGAEVARFGASGAQTAKLNKPCSLLNCDSVKETSANGIVMKREYADKAGRVFKVETKDILGHWHAKTSTYDKYGRAVSATSPGLQAITSHYDALDRLVKTIDPNTDTEAVQLIQAKQQLNSLRGGDIPEGEQLKVTAYNGLGEKYQVTDNLEGVLTYSYDAQGNLTKVHSSVDAQDLSIITYDTLGRKITMSDKNRGDWQYEYDALGQLTKQTDARGVITEIFYDNLGRKKHKKITGSSDVQSEEMFWQFGTGANKHRLLNESIGSWRRDYYYDNLGRAVANVTNLDGTTNCAANVSFNTVTNDLRITDASLADPINSRCVIQQTSYDQYGRVFQQFDDYRRQSSGVFVEARGIRQHYQNNQVVKQQEAREGSAGRIYREITQLTADGQLKQYRKGNYTMTLGYDYANRVISTSSGNHIQLETYEYDGINNLSSRTLTAQAKQTFAYDGLNRVTHVDGVERYVYDANGNIIEKDGWSHSYQPLSEQINKPLHAITQRSKNSTVETFGYDANGNQIWGKKNGGDWRKLTYSARNKALEVSVDGKTSYFSYDTNNRRFKRVEDNQTIFYVGNLELTIKGAIGSGQQQQFIKRYMGDALQTYYASGNSLTRWLFKDHLGSLVAIANDSGKLVKRFKYDVFGLQTEIIPTEVDRINYYEQTALSGIALAELPTNLRGYTGHEPVAFDGDNRIIHMNGRMYDAALGRMLQADPVVQAPDNLQNYNSYSYVLNNPLNATDPSGYFFKKLLKGFMKITGMWATHKFINSIPFLNQIISTVLNFIPFCQYWCSAVWNAHATFVATGSLSAGLKAGAISAITSAVGGGGISVDGFSGFIVSGVVGGALSAMQGGKFGHGFISAGVGMLGGALGQLSGLTSTAIGRVATAALIGGTTSKLTGGKFANGAISAGIAIAMKESFRGRVEDNMNKNRSLTKKDRQLTDEEIKIANDNFNKVKSDALKDYENGYFGDKSQGELMYVEENDVIFVESLGVDEAGNEILGSISPTEYNAYTSAKISISASGCVSLTTCYKTFGHEFAHTNIAGFYDLLPGYSDNIWTHYNSDRFDLYLSVGRKTHSEDYAEYWGRKWARSKGY